MRIALLLLSLCLPLSALGQTQDLENPGTVSAIQDRPYVMGHELNLAVGWLPLDAFYKGYFGQVAYTFHFTDSFAWQVGRGSYNYVVKTGLREQLERDFGTLPTVSDEIQYFIGSDLLWKPFYGKTAVLNRKVLQFESHLILGATIYKFTNSNFRPAINFGGGIRLFQSRWLSYRLDITNGLVLSDSPINVLSIQLMLALNFVGDK